MCDYGGSQLVFRWGEVIVCDYVGFANKVTSSPEVEMRCNDDDLRHHMQNGILLLSIALQWRYICLGTV